MKKTNILKILFLLALLPKFASAVHINQVYYDPDTSETTGEAIELYNPNPFDVDIGGWVIATETSLKDAVVPANSIIKAKGYYLIADEGWNTTKDSAWRDADHTEKITMNNANSGIALTYSNGTFVDAVGWGTSSEIKNNLYEGTPATDVKEGKVLLRTKDTGDNSADFIESTPDFPDPNSIKITVNVTNNTGNVSSVEIKLDDDAGKEGIQIKPLGGGTKRVRLVAAASSEVTATFLNQTIDFEEIDTGIYEGFLELDFSLAPGNYSIQIGQDTVHFEYLSLLDFAVQANKISFNAAPGKESILDAPATIKNTGNVELSLELSTGDLTADDNTISADNLKLSTDGETFNDLEDTLTVEPGEELELYFSLFVPSGTKLGSYSSNIVLKAERV
jgi:hypothetical protein